MTVPLAANVAEEGAQTVAVLADHEARVRIATDLDATLIVEAAAGTGKTSALVARMVRVLMGGRARLDQVVAVTFTEAAAGELKLRLRAEIERAREAADTSADARRLLEASLPQLEEARIGTIHSFCADLLRERPVEAGVDPLFEVAPDDVAGELFRRAFDRWFERTLAAPGEGVRRILRRPTRDEDGPRGLLRAAAFELAARRDFPAAWRHQPYAREPAIDALLEEMAPLAACAAAGDPDDFFTRSLLALAHFLDEIRRREIGRPRDYDALEAELGKLCREKHWGWTGYQRSTRDGFPKAELKQRRDALHTHLRVFVDAAGADLAPRLRDELWPVIEDYERLKVRAGCLDFLDLLLRARDLVRHNAEVRRELQRRTSHLFVDEFQDTDPLQAEILLLIASDDPAADDWSGVRPIPGKLFLVGDPKQSIYRFRRADVALYEAVKRRLVDAGADVVHLQVSFRAVPDIQAAVNAAFGPRMQGQSPSQATYVPLAPFRGGIATQPAIVALPVPAPYGDYGKVVDWKIDDSLPDAIAAFVEWVIRQSGWTVTERERGERVPIEPRHVCLLFRRFRSYGRDVTRLYVRALEARQLPHVLVGGSSFHEREEVEAIRNALEAIERPDDDLAVFATLRGPFFALTDATLLAFRDRFRSLHPFRKLPADLPPPLADVAAALAILRDLHLDRNRQPLPDTIGRFLARTRAHAGLANWPTGEQALANVTRLMDLARRAERHGVTSFRRFVERLAEDAARAEASDAPIIEEGTGGIRIMTVHRAKGLEFPVVALADPTAKDTPAEPSRYTDPARQLCAVRLAGAAPPELLEHRDEELEREREESARVLYVATTRARDLLIVPTIGDERRDGWLAALAPVLYPDDVHRRRPETREPPGCPAFGLDTVAVRPPRAPSRERAVAPGLHRPEAGTAAVVWWDPSVLKLGTVESVGLRQQRLLETDTTGAAAERGVEAHDAWQRTRVAVRATAGVPTVRVVAATEWAARTSAAGDDHDARGGLTTTADRVVVETCGPTTTRPHGKRFGALVHAVLATVDLDAGDGALAAVAAAHARVLGANDDERAAAVDAAAAALRHPLLRRAADAARAGRCRRETALALRLDDGMLVEGVVDVAFVDSDGWTVVDFKTDVEIAGRLDEYRAQVALYAAAIARATALPVHAVLLRV